jgi:hypothetical protein
MRSIFVLADFIFFESLAMKSNEKFFSLILL